MLAALRAGSADILRLILAEGLAMAVLGVGIGAVAAVALNSFLETMLYEVSGTDPWVHVVVAAVAVAVAAVACAIPAHRATLVDPVRALQGE